VAINIYYTPSAERSTWRLTEHHFDYLHSRKTEATFAQGNGFIGMRAVQEEYALKKEPGLYISGTFHRESGPEVPELPNILDITGIHLEMDGEMFSLFTGSVIHYEKSLDLETGELRRDVHWRSPLGKEYLLLFRRFVSLSDIHLIGMQIVITSLTGSCNVIVNSGIDTRQTNSGTQHFPEGTFQFFNQEYLISGQAASDSSVEIISGTTIILENGAQSTSSEHDSASYTPPAGTVKQYINRRKAGFINTAQAETGKPLTISKYTYISTHSTQELSAGFAGPEGATGIRPEDLQETHLKIREEISSPIIEKLQTYRSEGYQKLLNSSRSAWRNWWNGCDVEITGSDEEQLSLRAALYHLRIMTPYHDARCGIGAKGLTGEGYKGHSFWDTELFILPFYLYTDPREASALLQYRYHTLPGAQRKAIANGSQGAMYAWESADTGDEATPEFGELDIEKGIRERYLFGNYEQHVTADVAFAVNLMRTADVDEQFMKNYGYRILFETARFWASRVENRDDPRGLVLTDIIGPDEYSFPADNNAYTNHLVGLNLEVAAASYEELRETSPEWLAEAFPTITSESAALWAETAKNLYRPEPNSDNIIPQDDFFLNQPIIDISAYRNGKQPGAILKDYSLAQIFRLQVAKQADVVMLLFLFPELFPRSAAISSFLYYEPKTLHDSSLSAAVHAAVAARLDLTDMAAAFFQKACSIDFGSALRSSDEGIHAAAMGGLWQAAVLGFCGFSMKHQQISLDPKLPTTWNSCRFRILTAGSTVTITITESQITLLAHIRLAEPITVRYKSKTYLFRDTLIISR
jgi:hypothetical glycosyl hydrolase